MTCSDPILLTKSYYKRLIDKSTHSIYISLVMQSISHSRINECNCINCNSSTYRPQGSSSGTRTILLVHTCQRFSQSKCCTIAFYYIHLCYVKCSTSLLIIRSCSNERLSHHIHSLYMHVVTQPSKPSSLCLLLCN